MPKTNSEWDTFLVRFLKSMVISLLFPLLVIFVIILVLPDQSFDIPEVNNIICSPDVIEHSMVNGFVRKWDGTCYGWYNNLAYRHMVADALTFVLYSMMTCLILFWHPIERNRTSSYVSIVMVALIFLGCGVIHLMEAISVVYPVYEEMAAAKEIVNSISTIALIFLGLGLTAFHIRNGGRYVDSAG